MSRFNDKLTEFRRAVNFSHEKTTAAQEPDGPQQEPEVEPPEIPGDVDRNWLDEHLPTMSADQIEAVMRQLEQRGWSAVELQKEILPHLISKLGKAEKVAMVTGLREHGVSDREIAILVPGLGVEGDDAPQDQEDERTLAETSSALLSDLRAAVPDIDLNWLDEHLPTMSADQIEAVMRQLEQRGWSAVELQPVMLHLIPKLEGQKRDAIVAGLREQGMADHEIEGSLPGLVSTEAVDAPKGTDSMSEDDSAAVEVATTERVRLRRATETDDVAPDNTWIFAALADDDSEAFIIGRYSDQSLSDLLANQFEWPVQLGWGFEVGAKPHWIYRGRYFLVVPGVEASAEEPEVVSNVIERRFGALPEADRESIEKFRDEHLPSPWRPVDFAIDGWRRGIEGAGPDDVIFSLSAEWISLDGADISNVAHAGGWRQRKNLFVLESLQTLMSDGTLTEVEGLECLASFEGEEDTAPQASSSREPIPQAVRHGVWNRDGGCCVQCGSKERLEFDHIIPIARGGSNTERNLQLLCESCNRRKGAQI